MIYIIKFKSEPLKFINKQSKPQKIRILKAINNLPNRELVGIKNQILYRLKIGNYRIIYSLENNVITILTANNRGDIYKNI